MEYKRDHNNPKILRCLVDGKMHNEFGPSYIEFFPNGKVYKEVYHIEGKRHREAGPALYQYQEDGSLRQVKYYLNGVISREEGPAHIAYETGTIFPYEAFHIDGKPVNIPDFNENKRNIKK